MKGAGDLGENPGRPVGVSIEETEKIRGRLAGHAVRGDCEKEGEVLPVPSWGGSDAAPKYPSQKLLQGPSCGAYSTGQTPTDPQPMRCEELPAPEYTHAHRIRAYSSLQCM